MRISMYNRFDLPMEQRVFMENGHTYRQLSQYLNYIVHHYNSDGVCDFFERKGRFSSWITDAVDMFDDLDENGKLSISIQESLIERRLSPRVVLCDDYDINQDVLVDGIHHGFGSCVQMMLEGADRNFNGLMTSAQLIKRRRTRVTFSFRSGMLRIYVIRDGKVRNITYNTLSKAESSANFSMKGGSTRPSTPNLTHGTGIVVNRLEQAALLMVLFVDPSSGLDDNVRLMSTGEALDIILTKVIRHGMKLGLLPGFEESHLARLDQINSDSEGLWNKVHKRNDGVHIHSEKAAMLWPLSFKGPNAMFRDTGVAHPFMWCCDYIMGLLDWREPEDQSVVKSASLPKELKKQFPTMSKPEIKAAMMELRERSWNYPTLRILMSLNAAESDHRGLGHDLWLTPEQRLTLSNKLTSTLKMDYKVADGDQFLYEDDWHINSQSRRVVRLDHPQIVSLGDLVKRFGIKRVSTWIDQIDQADPLHVRILTDVGMNLTAIENMIWGRTTFLADVPFEDMAEYRQAWAEQFRIVLDRHLKGEFTAMHDALINFLRWLREQNLRVTNEEYAREMNTPLRDELKQVYDKIDGVEIIPGITIKVPTCGFDLVEWGNMMTHCIGSYATRVRTGDNYAIALMRDGKMYANAMWDQRGNMQQLLGVQNRNVPEAMEICEALFNMGALKTMPTDSSFTH